MNLNKVSAVGAKISKIRFAIGLTIVGLFLAAIGGFITFKNKDSESNYQPVEAEVVEVLDESMLTEGEWEVTLSYVVDGVTYTPTFTLQNPEVGQKVTIYYDANNPDNVSSSADGGKMIPIIILIVGCVATVGGVVLLVKSIKTKATSPLEQVDMSKVSEEEVNAIKNSEEPTKEYYFHFCGKMNQSYILETPERTPIVTLDCDKIALVGNYKYRFTNKITCVSKDYEVSHTVTTSYGGDGFSLPIKSTFKMNKEDVFSMIGKMGYSIISKIEGLKLNFDVCHYGVPVATLKAAGANVAKADKNYGKAGELPTTGVFVINCRESDLDAVALIAFAVSRVEFF